MKNENSITMQMVFDAWYKISNKLPEDIVSNFIRETDEAIHLGSVL